ncbi:MAG: hypothetical protein JWN72_724 [Thermoleophilia bacterium]|nr:hypothetical protein [Thermoleophilia bacterium]
MYVGGSREQVAPTARAELRAAGIEGATLWSCLGLYEDAAEESCVLEVVDLDPGRAAALAAALRTALDQDEVVWTTHEVLRARALRPALEAAR